jgi:YHS domain-containing protein
MSLRRSRLDRLAAGFHFVLAVVCAGSAAGADQSGDASSIAWRDDYATALEEARTANRPLWIQFTGPWCPHCTRMEHESLPHPVIVQHARESFVPLMLRSDIHEQLAQNFHVTGLPATIVVAPNREVVAVQQGYLGPGDLDAFLRDCLSRVPATAGTAAEKSAAPARVRPGPDDTAHHEPLALGGYCVVSLIRDRKLVSGQSEHTVKHNGRTYRFASSALSDMFRAEPERYVPANNGVCPVTQLEQGKAQAGDPRWGILYKGHLYVFASEGDRRLFVKEPDRYAMVDVAEQGFCLHCIRESGLLVRGDPRHELSRDGRRYWFPDASHRDAFVASLR